ITNNLSSDNNPNNNIHDNRTERVIPTPRGGRRRGPGFSLPETRALLDACRLNLTAPQTVWNWSVIADSLNNSFHQGKQVRNGDGCKRKFQALMRQGQDGAEDLVHAATVINDLMRNR
ncbi:MAG: hypothetical protein ACKPKO_44480, partial [Candidatus Fonsibacter sp.]